MSPITLLFSPDEEASRPLVRALHELDLEVERCPDVFTAIEWLTTRSFEVVAADWDSGPEAGFLLKNARELKLNQSAFTLALTSGTSCPEGDEDRPDLVLTKPLIPDQVKYAVLSNDRFLACMKAWIARGDSAPTNRPTSRPSDRNNLERQRTQLEYPSPTLSHPSATLSEVRSPKRSLVASGVRAEASPPLHLTFATLDRKMFRSMNQQNKLAHGPRKVQRYNRNRFLLGSVLTVAFVGYIFGQPLRVQTVFASVASAYKQALQMKSSLLESSDSDDDASSSALAKPIVAPHRALRTRLRGIPAEATSLPNQPPESPAETEPADADLEQDRLAPSAPQIQIPESLKAPLPETAELRVVSLNRSPSPLSQVEPVTLAEDLSQALLVQKVPPSYPEQALKAGLQGAVTLQAWIGKDGSIRDLKLLNGSLLLGQAAVKAVKQWRYKPYLRNGVAVEAETYVTVDFRLP